MQAGQVEWRVAPEPSRSFWVTALIGAGIMAAVDQIVFHQILGWHHFYDLATPAVGLASDGLLHAAELIAVVAGFFLFADLRRRQALAASWAWAGFFVGAGAFQLFDGLVNHKVLRLHQIRYGVYLLPYDVAWIGSALLLLAVGALLWLRARRDDRSPARTT
jgi:uncharacterized membrane protein